MQVKNQLTLLTIIHGSLVFGLLIFCGVVYWQNPSFNSSTDASDMFIYIVPLLATIGYFASKFIFQSLIEKIELKESLQHKLARYQRASIIKYALLEAPAFLALIAYYLKGNALHLVVALCLIAYLISQRPSMKRFQNDIPLSIEEEKQIAI